MQRLEEMFGKLEEEIIERFEENFTAQNQKIVDLEEKIALQEKKIKNLSIKCDDNEQYSRQYCLRMNDKNVFENTIKMRVKTILFQKSLNVLVKSVCLTRKRRQIGCKPYKPYKNGSLGLTMKTIIIKFKSWRYRPNVYWN